MKKLDDTNIEFALLDPLLKYLGSRTDVCDIHLEAYPPSVSAISDWEQTNNCLLSDDVKLFYTMCNGFHLKWNYRFNETSVTVSDYRINSLENLKKLSISSRYNNCFDPSELYLSHNGTENEVQKLKFTDQKLFYELDACEGYSKVCLVFNKPNYKTDSIAEPQCSVWLIDRSLLLHHLTDTFSSYLILMMSHCAIKQWQYAFTDIGLSPQTRQWLILLCPSRLKIDEKDELPDVDRNINWPLVKFNAERIFNVKQDNK